MTYLVASVAVLLVGPLTYALAGRATRALRVLDIVVVGSVGALLLLHILPEIFARIGWLAAIPLLLGLLGPTLLERGLAGLERQAHAAMVLVVLFGLGLHALLDGVVLALPAAHLHGGRADPALPLAVVLHRIPVSLLVWWLVRPRWGATAAAVVLVIEGAGAIVGFLGAQAVVAHLHTPLVAAVQALVAGSILHVLVDRHDYVAPEGHAH